MSGLSVSAATGIQGRDVRLERRRSRSLVSKLETLFGCEAKNEGLTLAQRNWTCPSCGASHDRDMIAARNLVRCAESSPASACGADGSGDKSDLTAKPARRSTEDLSMQISTAHNHSIDWLRISKLTPLHGWGRSRRLEIRVDKIVALEKNARAVIRRHRVRKAIPEVELRRMAPTLAIP